MEAISSKVTANISCKTNASRSGGVPLSQGSWTHGVRVGSQEGNSKFTWVSPSYFETMGIPIVRGRSFTLDDTASSPRVAVVNETFVRRYLSGVEPIGQTLRTGQEPNYPSTVYEIVGVIPDTKYNDLRGQIPPMTFAPASQFPNQGPWSNVMIHSNLAPAAIAATAKRQIAGKHRDVITEVLALAAARGASSLLFDLRPHDPFTFAVATGVLVSIALIASLVPARRAARVDPMVALRYE